MIKSINRRLRRALSPVLLALLTVIPAAAQFDSASVLGTVRDSSGAAMAGAKVTLENTKTGIAADDQHRL